MQGGLVEKQDGSAHSVVGGWDEDRESIRARLDSRSALHVVLQGFHRGLPSVVGQVAAEDLGLEPAWQVGAWHKHTSVAAAWWHGNAARQQDGAAWQKR